MAHPRTLNDFSRGRRAAIAPPRRPLDPRPRPAGRAPTSQRRDPSAPSPARAALIILSSAASGPSGRSRPTSSCRRCRRLRTTWSLPAAVAVTVTTFLIGLGVRPGAVAGPAERHPRPAPTAAGRPAPLHRRERSSVRVAPTVRGAHRRPLPAGHGRRVRPGHLQRDGHRLRARARGGPALLAARHHRRRGAASSLR